MNVIRKLTWQYMKKNKRRTIVTVIGIIISVAMMTAVTTACASFTDLYERKTIAQDGAWHVIYKDVPKEKTAVITGDENSEKTMISADLGYDMIDSENEYKPYVFVKAYNAERFDMVPLTLKKGRLPKNGRELVIPEHLVKNGGVYWNVGDKVKITLSDRIIADADGQPFSLTQQNSFADENNGAERLEPKAAAREYTIVGIAERPEFEPYWAPGYTAITALDADETVVSDFNVSVWQKKIDKSIFDDSEALAAAAGIDKENISYNYTLLGLSGIAGANGFLTMMYTLVVLLMIVIVISSVSLIYNAFAISLTERSRQLGMLAGVGATKRQKRASVYYEGFLVGIISIPVGIASGIGGLAVAFKCIAPIFKSTFSSWDQELYVVVSWPAVFVAAFVAALTIFISTCVPARRASAISPIDGIRQNHDIRLTKKEVKTSKLTRKIFGFEGEIALKNLKRNKKRYRATVVSMAVSIILFLGVSGFVESLKQSSETMLDIYKIDFEIDAEKEDYEEISELSGVVKSTELTRSVMLCTKKEGLPVSDQFTEAKREMITDEGGMMAVSEEDYAVILYALDNESMRQFLEEAGIAPTALDGENKAVLLNKAMLIGTKSRGEVSMYECEAGQKIVLDYIKLVYDDAAGDYSEERHMVGEVEIGAVTETIPWCVDTRMDLYESETVRLVVTEETLQNIINADDLIPHAYTKLCLDSEKPEDTMEALDDYIAKYGEARSIFYHSAWKTVESNENTLLLISVFAYGFIILMTAICTANIVNTTSTGISMRRKEFAMLKSVGMTPGAFNKMIVYESLFYGLKALLFGLPAGFLLMWLFYQITRSAIYGHFTLPWLNIILAVVMIFLITGVSMMYSVKKIRKENVIEALKGE